MADLSAKKPVELEKLGAYLHDRTRMPASPRPGPAGWARANWGLLLGVAFAAGFIALAFEIRDGWENHREWVVATTVPMLVVAGLAYGHLVGRGKAGALASSGAFLVLTLVFTFADVWVGESAPERHTLRDTLTILAGVGLAITVLTAIITLVAVEWRNPPRAPMAAETT